MCRACSQGKGIRAPSRGLRVCVHRVHTQASSKCHGELIRIVPCWFAEQQASQHFPDQFRKVLILRARKPRVFRLGFSRIARSRINVVFLLRQGGWLIVLRRT